MLVVLLIALPGFGKSLHWKSIDVQARLDAEGRLHVVERQRMVFDGDWNGGERELNVLAPQRVEVHGVTRVEDGREVPLVRGNLKQVDHWDLVTDSLIRWRSRLESDPPFQNREITYVLDFTYDRVIWQDPERNALVLSHDFGLPQRQGVVEQFTLDLQFDPRWSMAPVRETRTDLAPGRGVVVDRTFAIPQGAWPAGIVQRRPEWTGAAALGAFLLAIAALIAAFAYSESKRGRFARVEPALDPELMKLKPEILGAIWDAGVEAKEVGDRAVGPPEVAAVLARLTQEGKIESRAEKKVLHMRLLVPRSELAGYERMLVGQIFVDGDEIDTKKLKTHYRGTRFDPAATIRPGIHNAIAEAVPGWDTRQRRFSVKTHVFTLIAIAAVLIALAVFGDGEDVGEIVVIGVAGAIFGTLGCGVAYSRSRAIAGYTRAFLAPAILMAFPSALIALGAWRAFPGRRLSAIALTMCSLLVLAIIRLALDLMKIRDTREVLAVRKRAVAVRQYFREQLRRPQPALRDEWFPYLIAFGLGKHADRWFRAFGSAGSSSSSSSSSSWGSASGSSSASGWTGGGGAFGGAGATGSWAVAAGTLAAGVSSGGSSGGSSSGSSSGGGGGGGW